MIKINLLSEGRRPAAVRKARTPGSQPSNIGNWLLLTGVLLGGLAFGGRYYVLNQALDDKRAEVAQAQKEVDELQAVIKEVEDYKAKEMELERKIKIINDLKLNQRGPVRVMDYISRALPELLWLDRMRMSAATIELEGRAFNTNAEAAFLENLDKVPEFKEPSLKDTTVQAFGLYRFVIDFDYTFAPPTQRGQAGANPAGAAAPVAPGAAAPNPAAPPAAAPTEAKPRPSAVGR
jgi:Tfp pilus assembly protein PilN